LALHSYQAKRAQVEQQMLDTAQTIGLSIDSELSGIRSALMALSTSPSMAKGDYAAFHHQARELLDSYPPESNIVLADRSGQQLMNTVLPFGPALPKRNNAQAVEKVFATGRPVFSDLFFGAISHKPYVGVDVPVRVGKEIRYDLACVIPTGTLTEILRKSKLPQHWIASVVDSKGLVVARTQTPEQFIGKQATRKVLDFLETGGTGLFETTNFEGQPSIFVVSKSPETGLAIVLIVPLQLLNQELWQWMLWSGLACILLSILGLGLGMLMARSIADPIRSLVQSAELLGRGHEPRIPLSQLNEAHAVEAALRDAYQLLAAREEERAEATSRLAESNAKLGRSNAELEQFAYVASHDLRQPLRMISSYVALLERYYHDALDDQAREFIAFAVQGAKRMDRLIVDLLEYSRIGRRERPMELIPLSEILREASMNLRPATEEAGGSVTLPDNLPTISGNREELVRLFQNLIGNGLKYHAPDRPPVITLTCRADAGDWLVEVKDNGIGIEAKYFDSIFGIFQRLHTEDSYEGTGIGLAVCKKIIEHHGGSISVSSEPGQGSSFQVRLPG